MFSSAEDEEDVDFSAISMDLTIPIYLQSSPAHSPHIIAVVTQSPARAPIKSSTMICSPIPTIILTSPETTPTSSQQFLSVTVESDTTRGYSESFLGFNYIDRKYTTSSSCPPCLPVPNNPNENDRTNGYSQYALSISYIDRTITPLSVTTESDRTRGYSEASLGNNYTDRKSSNSPPFQATRKKEGWVRRMMRRVRPRWL